MGQVCEPKTTQAFTKGQIELYPAQEAGRAAGATVNDFLSAGFLRQEPADRKAPRVVTQSAKILRSFSFCLQVNGEQVIRLKFRDADLPAFAVHSN